MKTAVEYLASVISQSGPITEDDFNSLVKQAKEMEKEQIIDAYKYGNQSDVYYKPEQYYNETFKSE